MDARGLLLCQVIYIMPILQFVFSTSAELLPIPLVLFFGDLLVSTFVQIAFGTTHGFFRYRYKLPDSVMGTTTKRSSLEDIMSGG